MCTTPILLILSFASKVLYDRPLQALSIDFTINGLSQPPAITTEVSIEALVKLHHSPAHLMTLPESSIDKPKPTMIIYYHFLTSLLQKRNHLSLYLSQCISSPWMAGRSVGAASTGRKKLSVVRYPRCVAVLWNVVKSLSGSLLSSLVKNQIGEGICWIKKHAPGTLRSSAYYRAQCKDNDYIRNCS